MRDPNKQELTDRERQQLKKLLDAIETPPQIEHLTDDQFEAMRAELDRQGGAFNSLFGHLMDCAECRDISIERGIFTPEHFPESE